MKRTIALLLGLLLCLTALTAASGDPLISRSYLEGEFLQSLTSAIKGRLDVSAPGGVPPVPAGTDGTLELKEGDILSGHTGLTVTPLGGEVRISGGAVVDVTEGMELAGSQTLLAGHRYIVAENPVDFTVSTPAAVLLREGGGELTLSLTPDYYAIARALRSLDLFRGSGSGIGEGFDLHLAPTRGEGLVMFLRILGEEEQALAYLDGHPFTDVPAWLDRYVAWAYAKGYANGVAPDKFGTEQRISAAEYEEFLLRALGYSVAGVDDYATSLERGLACGALTSGEYAMLRSQTFLRAHVAYISYYTLDVPVSGSQQTLAQRLAAAGAITAEQLSAARVQAGSERLE